jgi:ABC-type multidrug transport system fused ATPase/permease subunit
MNTTVVAGLASTHEIKEFCNILNDNHQNLQQTLERLESEQFSTNTKIITDLNKVKNELKLKEDKVNHTLDLIRRENFDIKCSLRKLYNTLFLIMLLSAVAVAIITVYHFN